VSGTPPQPLIALLGATDPASRELAWQRFVAGYSDLILSAARSLGGDEDACMDRYAFVLDQLKRDDCRRLRNYSGDRGARFTTWLVVVVRRLSLDEYRQRNGRLHGEDDEARARHEMRRRLGALLGGDAELDALRETGNDPHDALRAAELHEALERAIGTLEPRDRLILRLRFEDGESVPTIARMLRAASAGHVYRRLEALLAELRTKLVAAGITDPSP
jgi:RNA polymerase sigma factor (sigma-70 family)